MNAPALHARIADLLDKTRRLPGDEARRREEPDALALIRAACPQDEAAPSWNPADVNIENAVLGAWLGRVGGCLLGKPVEGFRRGPLRALLEAQDNWPLERYIAAPAEEILKAHGLPPADGRGFIDRIERMIEDDDVNYTVIGLLVLEEHGMDFTPEHVAQTWLARLPIFSTCTAERVAYKNVALGLMPPASALHGNPYREWIGAQIRADAYGYVALGDPALAAEWAWRDASVSHVANGIYGEMWAAAMIAAAPFADTPREVVERGLREIPRHSRLAKAIQDVLAQHEAGLDYDAAVDRIHQQWDEARPHHWCHTISNAQIVALALLWGEDDPALSICRAVQPAFDTDCNGATVGSIMGMRHGARAMPEWLVEPLAQGFETGVRGEGRLTVAEAAERTVRLLASRSGG